MGRGRPADPATARRRRDYLHAWAAWHAFSPADQSGPVFRSLAAADRAEARELWRCLLRRWVRWSECNAYLAGEGADDPEWEALDAKLQRMSGKLSGAVSEVAEWAAMELAEVAELLAESWTQQRKRP